MYKKYIQLGDRKGVTGYRVSVETGISASMFLDWKSVLTYIFGTIIKQTLEELGLWEDELPWGSVKQSMKIWSQQKGSEEP